MWQWIKGICTAMGIVIACIGLIDLPDQLVKWHKLMLETGMSSERGRWALVIAGLVIALISSDFHRKLYHRIISGFRPKDVTLPPAPIPEISFLHDGIKI